MIYFICIEFNNSSKPFLTPAIFDRISQCELTRGKIFALKLRQLLLSTRANLQLFDLVSWLESFSITFSIAFLLIGNAGASTNINGFPLVGLVTYEQDNFDPLVHFSSRCRSVQTRVCHSHVAVGSRFQRGDRAGLSR